MQSSSGKVMRQGQTPYVRNVQFVVGEETETETETERMNENKRERGGQGLQDA